MKARLVNPCLTVIQSSFLKNIAIALSYNDITVRCCQKIEPDRYTCSDEWQRIESKKHSYEWLRIEDKKPSYEWFDFNPRKPSEFYPIEPEIIRDYIENGDRNIRFTKDQHGDRWETDCHYNGIFSH